ncbi:MarC family protein [Planctobacterium marinum]|uniref:MarC family protein n=1 Tax=Planctobacterium marinum TaxID=1631968 RepID=UPI001E3FF74B|nr:MarC family protein [Planctobacterium marinum]MCC2604053.1 NAAT family transporter [Planctobacterium marinum]
MEILDSIISLTLVLLFVIDPFGNVPIILSVLKEVPKERKRKIIFRETLIGLALLLIFLFFGEHFLKLFGLQTEAVTIAGGVILFVIGIKMIFPPPKGHSIFGGEGEPFVVPIAMPMIAGPSALATLMVMSKTSQLSLPMLTLSVLIAWAITMVVLLSAPFMLRILKDKGLLALERLMGMLLLIMSVQMFINGLFGLLKKAPL